MKPGTQEAIVAQEGKVERRFDVDHQYYDWGLVPGEHERWTVGQGRIPFVALGSKRNPAVSLHASGLAGEVSRRRSPYYLPLPARRRVPLVTVTEVGDMGHQVQGIRIPRAPLPGLDALWDFLLRMS